MPLEHLLIFSFLLFSFGVAGVAVRKNLLVILMSVELMLNAVNLAFVGVARLIGGHDAHVMVLMIYVVAAVEVAIGMAIVVNMFRQKDTISVDSFDALRG